MRYLTVYKNFKHNLAKFSKKEQDEIWQAYVLAKKQHQYQLCYPAFPYIIHPVGVANWLIHFGYYDYELIISALLHDIIEDTPTTLVQVRKKFGGRVAGLVKGLTRVKPKSENTPAQRYQNKAKDFRKTMKGPKNVMVIKACDTLFNVTFWHYNPKDSLQGQKFPRRIKECEDLYLPLAKKADIKIYQQMKKELAKFLKWYGQKPKFKV